MGSCAEETVPEAECVAFMELAVEQVMGCPLSFKFQLRCLVLNYPITRFSPF